MEKLTLKELAPYLPYNLMVLNLHTNLTYNLTGRVIDRVANLNESHKPILRNLSDLTKEIEHNGEKFVFSDVYFSNSKIEKLQDKSLCLFGNPLNEIDYNSVQTLIKHHFDVFNLLDKNLAVPVTENFNPYK